MKPGRATVETLTDNILNYETSRRADRARSFREKLLYRLKGLAVGAAPPPSVALLARDAEVELDAMSVAHRELRRAARRLAKMTLKLAADLRHEHAECDALCTRIVKLEAEIDRTSKDEWDDKELSPEEEQAMHEAFPTRSGRHELYAEAMRLVGAKRSKGELVKLVNWLLHRAQPPTDKHDTEYARAFLWRILGQQPPTNHVAELARMLARARAMGDRAA